jgi:hypothetical protein
MDAADIVRFTTQCTEDRERGKVPKRLGLVIKVIERDDGEMALIARGGSQKVCDQGRLPSEVVLTRPDELAAAGLTMPARFDLGDRCWVPARRITCLGKFPLRGSRARELMAALTRTA